MTLMITIWLACAPEEEEADSTPKAPELAYDGTCPETSFSDEATEAGDDYAVVKDIGIYFLDDSCTEVESITMDGAGEWPFTMPTVGGIGFGTGDWPYETFVRVADDQPFQWGPSVVHVTSDDPEWDAFVAELDNPDKSDLLIFNDEWYFGWAKPEVGSADVASVVFEYELQLDEDE